jgi:hypothetical protein
MALAERPGVAETAVARLAAHYGIEPGFRDARGEDVMTSPDMRRRPLAMGIE